jgi:hypothetical protein
MPNLGAAPHDWGFAKNAASFSHSGGTYKTNNVQGSLKACELIAEGGFSSVFKGLWQGLEVCIKVNSTRAQSSSSYTQTHTCTHAHTYTPIHAVCMHAHYT